MKYYLLLTALLILIAQTVFSGKPSSSEAGIGPFRMPAGSPPSIQEQEDRLNNAMKVREEMEQAQRQKEKNKGSIPTGKVNLPFNITTNPNNGAQNVNSKW